MSRCRPLKALQPVRARTCRGPGVATGLARAIDMLIFTSTFSGWHSLMWKRSPLSEYVLLPQRGQLNLALPLLIPVPPLFSRSPGWRPRRNRRPPGCPAYKNGAKQADRGALEGWANANGDRKPLRPKSKPDITNTENIRNIRN